MCQATLIPLHKTWSPPTNFVSCHMAASALCPRTSWKLSLSSTFKPGGQAAAFNTPRMVLPLPPAAAQSKSTLYVSHRPLKPLPGSCSTLYPRSSSVWSLLLLGEYARAAQTIRHQPENSQSRWLRCQTPSSDLLWSAGYCWCFSTLSSPRATGRYPPLGWYPQYTGLPPLDLDT